MRIHIYDTTLRDGSQGEGVNFSLQDKLLITQKLTSWASITSKALSAVEPQGCRVFPACPAPCRSSTPRWPLSA